MSQANSSVGPSTKHPTHRRGHNMAAEARKTTRTGAWHPSSVSRNGPCSTAALRRGALRSIGVGVTTTGGKRGGAGGGPLRSGGVGRTTTGGGWYGALGVAWAGARVNCWHTGHLNSFPAC